MREISCFFIALRNGLQLRNMAHNQFGLDASKDADLWQSFHMQSSNLWQKVGNPIKKNPKI